MLTQLILLQEQPTHSRLKKDEIKSYTDEEIKKAVKAGIRKMNFATDICYSFLDTCLEELQKPDRAVAIDNFMKNPIQAVKEFCISRIKLVGADGKA